MFVNNKIDGHLPHLDVTLIDNIYLLNDRRIKYET
jgi:hypothetical protein